MTDYLDGFCAAGLTHVEHGLLPGAGHFTFAAVTGT